VDGIPGPTNQIANFRGGPGVSRLRELGVRRISFAGGLHLAAFDELRRRVAAIAEHAVQRAAWVLRWRGEPREPKRIPADMHGVMTTYHRVALNPPAVRQLAGGAFAYAGRAAARLSCCMRAHSRGGCSWRRWSAWA
jgi:hypothetical protein